MERQMVCSQFVSGRKKNRKKRKKIWGETINPYFCTPKTNNTVVKTGKIL